ncbi:STAS domain-containing protein [Streptomyces sp. SBST2-5]|uniref:STAS domain-containing protein n=1 Tax=Streptomyces composti TaxID=2720025 RepID=A0ABX1A923_9ACTN|nr:STAS domain-containing protein [Streptomyces composti]
MSTVSVQPRLRAVHDPPGRLLLPLPPEIDFGNASEVLALVLSAVRWAPGRLRVLVLDFSGTGFMDSQGVRLVGDVSRSLHPDTRVRVVVRPDSTAGRVLDLTRLRRDVPVYDDAGDALRAWVPEAEAA